MNYVKYLKRAAVGLVLCPLLAVAQSYTPGALVETSGTGALSLTAPTRAVGNVLILGTSSRGSTATVGVETGWILLKDTDTAGNPSASLQCRIADNTSADNWSEDWSGTDQSEAIMVVLSGDEWDDCSTIVAHQNDRIANSGNVNYPSLTITTDSTFVVVYASKYKTATGDDNTFTGTEDGFTEIDTTVLPGISLARVLAYQQQTTATNVSTGSFGLVSGTSESLSTYAVIVALKTAAVSAPSFTDAPSIGTRTSSTIPVNATSDTTGTFYGVLMTDGSATPTCDAIEAQTVTGGLTYFAEAVVATVADTGTFTGLTTGAVKDGAFCIEDGSGNDSTVATIADMYKLPAWTVNPNLTAATSDGGTIGFTLDGPGDVDCVAVKKSDSTPSASQVDAGQNQAGSAALDAVTKAVTGADSVTINGLDLPKHDYHCIGKYGAQLSAVYSLDNQLRDALMNWQMVVLSTQGPSSPLEDITSPAVAADDIVELVTTMRPGPSCPATLDTDWDFFYTGCGASRQTACVRVYDDSVDNWMAVTGGLAPECDDVLNGEASWVFNNQSPSFSPPTDESTLTYNVDIGTITWANAANDPDADEVTCAAEGSYTNLILQSQTLDNASWTKTRSSISANATTAPDGTSTADKLVEDSTASNNHFILQGGTKAASAITYTMSVYVKAAERSQVMLQLGTTGATTRARAFFDLTALSVLSTAVVGSWTVDDTSIEAVNDGWVRVTMTATSDTGTDLWRWVYLASGGTDAYSGNGSSGLYVWGVQTQADAVATTYIPTTTAAASGDNLPFGTTLGGTGNCDQTGTPLIENEPGYTWTLRATDPYGAFADLAITQHVVETVPMPNCDGIDYSSCIELIVAATYGSVPEENIDVTLTCSPEPVFTVFAQDPAANEEIAPGAMATLTAARTCPSGGDRRGFGFGFGVR